MAGRLDGLRGECNFETGGSEEGGFRSILEMLVTLRAMD